MSSYTNKKKLRDPKAAFGIGNKSIHREANISLEKSSAWIINIYANDNDDENIVSYGDTSKNYNLFNSLDSTY